MAWDGWTGMRSTVCSSASGSDGPHAIMAISIRPFDHARHFIFHISLSAAVIPSVFRHLLLYLLSYRLGAGGIRPTPADNVLW
jgi:hypothetical protein